MSQDLALVSHHLCPYVQRAAIALSERGTPCRRINVDLASKPDWFRALSPLGKVPLLQVGDAVLFESSAILEYLEDTQPMALHPADPLQRAQHRGWIEFASATLNDIARFYSASDPEAFESARAALRAKFARLEDEHSGDAWFAGEAFSLVDAAFAPVFRYFDVFDGIADFAILSELPRLAAWRKRLSARSSVATAVDGDYAERLTAFLSAKPSHLASLMREPDATPRPDRQPPASRRRSRMGRM